MDTPTAETFHQLSTILSIRKLNTANRDIITHIDRAYTRKFSLGPSETNCKQNMFFPTIVRICKRNAHIKLKGYILYKTITSQNVSSEAQVKNIFISYKSYIPVSSKSYVPFSRYSSFCIFVHPMI